MASITVGPGGTSVQGDHQCSSNNFLGDQGNPLGNLIETVEEQRLTGITTVRYPSMAEMLDRHMPMQPTSSSRANGVKTYRTAVAYDGLLNTTGMKDITPATGGYNNPVTLRTADGGIRSKNIASRANINAEACNPVIDGPLPIVGREEYGRQSFVTRMPLPPMCFADYANKEHFMMHLDAVLGAVQNATMARWSADKFRWLIENCRFNAAPYQISQGNGKAKLPVSTALFSEGEFGRVPTHYGSPDWIAGQLRLSNIDPRQDLKVELPVAIFKRYKETLAREIGFNLWENSSNVTTAVNGYIRNIQNENLIYQDEVYGRKITFIATTEPTYVEVEETSTGGGGWRFQEPTIQRDSETAGNTMPTHNPNWGVACSSPGKTLAAIVLVSADNAKPFHCEPLPNDNPASGLNALIDKYAAGQGSKVNTTLRQMYPSTVETVILTGLDVQVHMLDEMNRRYREAGLACNIGSNLEHTWIAGYTKIAAQFVEDDPRSLTAFMLKMPVASNCVDLVVACEDFDAIPANGSFEPVIDPLIKQVVTLPDPVVPATPAAGTAYVIGKTTTITSPCSGTRTISVEFRRKGGTAGALTVTVAGTPSTHGGTVPGTVTFADGVSVAYLEWTIPAWACTEPEQSTETFVLTFSGSDYASDGITTRRICIKCNKACPAECEGDVGGCASC